MSRDYSWRASANQYVDSYIAALRAREVVGYLTGHTDLPVIASGGIMTPADAQAMFDLGAALVQLYTGFIYAGPALPARINAATRRGRVTEGDQR